MQPDAASAACRGLEGRKMSMCGACRGRGRGASGRTKQPCAFATQPSLMSRSIILRAAGRASPPCAPRSCSYRVLSGAACKPACNLHAPIPLRALYPPPSTRNTCTFSGIRPQRVPGAAAARTCNGAAAAPASRRAPSQAEAGRGCSEAHGRRREGQRRGSARATQPHPPQRRVQRRLRPARLLGALPVALCRPAWLSALRPLSAVCLPGRRCRLN